MEKELNGKRKEKQKTAAEGMWVARKRTKTFKRCIFNLNFRQKRQRKTGIQNWFQTAGVS